ncbi:MAG: hypothetical protein AB2693_16090, partial [Candidatus Thiodiazotropha sp.]
AEDSVGNIGRRFSLDMKTDSSGLRLIQLCKDSGLCIVNGRAGYDKGIGHFTFQGVQGRSVIDYALFPSDLFGSISDFVVHDLFSFSDHTPIEISLRAKYQTNEINETVKVEKLLWEKGELDGFRDILSDNLVDFDLLVDKIVHGNVSIDEGVSTFGTLLYNSAYKVFGQSMTINIGKINTPRKNTSPWFNNDCASARVELKQANKLFRKHKTQELHDLVVSKRKQYSKVKLRAQYCFL